MACIRDCWGAVAGSFVGVVWVSFEWLMDLRAGNHPATNWVVMIYEIGATLFGLGGAALGAVVGFFIGVMEAKDTRPTSSHVPPPSNKRLERTRRE